MTVSDRIKGSGVDCIFFHYFKLSSILIAETTFSSPDNLIILTPWVFLPAILISFTAVLITLPLLVEISTSSPSFTGNEDEILISTNKGRVIRVAVKEIRTAGRNTQGVRIIKLSGEEKVVSAIKIDDNLI